MGQYEDIELLTDTPDCAILDCIETDDVQEIEDAQEEFYFKETMREVTTI